MPVTVADQYAPFRAVSVNVSLRQKLSFACVSTLGPQSPPLLPFDRSKRLPKICPLFIRLYGMVIDRPWDEAIVPEFPAERPVLPRAVAQPPNCPRRQDHLYRHQIVAYREASIALKI